MAILTFAALRDEYAKLWKTAELRPSQVPAANATASKILANKARYKEVQEQTGVPWFVIGAIHAMESGCNFATHLHNGDPLTARTRLVPAGRPRTGKPPFGWVESACDALLMKNLQTIDDWGPERICYELERYNGHGYRQYHPTVLSPYLWSGTTHYSRGKYVADGKWSSTAVSGQSGAVIILRCLMEKDAEVRMLLDTSHFAIPAADPPVPANLEFPKAEAPSALSSVAHETYHSRSVWAAVTGVGTTVGALLTDWAEKGWEWATYLIGIVPHVKNDVEAVVSPLNEVADLMYLSIKPIAITIAAVCVVVFVVRHVKLRMEAQSSSS